MYVTVTEARVLVYPLVVHLRKDICTDNKRHRVTTYGRMIDGKAEWHHFMAS